MLCKYLHAVLLCMHPQKCILYDNAVVNVWREWHTAMSTSCHNFPSAFGSLLPLIHQASSLGRKWAPCYQTAMILKASCAISFQHMPSTDHFLSLDTLPELQFWTSLSPPLTENNFSGFLVGASSCVPSIFCSFLEFTLVDLLTPLSLQHTYLYLQVPLTKTNKC